MIYIKVGLLFNFINIIFNNGLGLGVLTKTSSIQERAFCDMTSQTAGGTTSAPETRSNINDRWGPIDAPYEYWFLNFYSRFFTQSLFYLLIVKVKELQYLLFKVEVLQIVFFVRLSITNSIEIILDVLFLIKFCFQKLYLHYTFYSII